VHSGLEIGIEENMARVSKMAAALTAKEFQRTVERLSGWTQRAKDAAYAVLVDGRTGEDVGQEIGATRQQVHHWVSDIYAIFEPDGWVTQTVTLPPDAMARAKEMERTARAEWEAALLPPRIWRG
jgi:TrfB plasmid transcriptional repressor